MQQREKNLLIGLVAAVLLWQGGKVLSSTFLEPLWTRQKDLEKLQESVSEKNKGLILLARQKKQMEGWKRRSLPPDPASMLKRTAGTQGGPRPSASNAQRLYQDWLLDLAVLSGFEQLKISPERMTVSPDNVYVSVHVKIDAEPRYEQLCRFLDRFYRTDLLHRITSIRIQSTEAEGDPFLKVLIEAEGLALIDAPQRRQLFAQTTLVEDLPEDGTTLKLKSVEGFPEKPGFLIRVKNEFVTVTAMEGNVWTVERAQDGTTAASVPAGSIVEDAPRNPDVAFRTDEQIKQLLASNVFLKPVPPTQYKPKVSPLGEKSHMRGKPMEFNIVVTGYDPGRGRPEFTLIEPINPGSRIDKASGKFSWAPTSDQMAGKYAFKFEVKHPSIAGGRLTDTFNVALREPNTAPKVAQKAVPPVYIGRKWTFKPEATDAESASDRLTWKLGENPPTGLEIDSTTGELTWTPGDDVEISKVKVNVVATDDGSPPLSITLPLELDIQDDAATFTFLTTIFFRDEIPLAVFYDRSKGKSIELKVGSRFAVADIRGVVTSIEKKFMMFSREDVSYRIELGQSLREILDKAEKSAEATTARPDKASEKPAGADRQRGGGASQPDAAAPSDATQPSNASPTGRSSEKDD